MCAFTVGSKDSRQELKTHTPIIQLLGGKDKPRYIKVRCFNTILSHIKSMIDSGCTTSIIKLSALKDPNDVNERVDLIGIAGSMKGLGSTEILFKLGKKTIFEKFQVVADDAQPSGLDGIAGKDICMNSIIDQNKNILIYHDPDEKENHVSWHVMYLNIEHG